MAAPKKRPLGPVPKLGDEQPGCVAAPRTQRGKATHWNSRYGRKDNNVRLQNEAGELKPPERDERASRTAVDMILECESDHVAAPPAASPPTGHSPQVGPEQRPKRVTMPLS
jgi:hypothetical protein